MALNDHKIANLTNPIESLSDHPSADGINAETLKKAFDKSPNEIKDKLNDVIDNLLSNTDNDSGADNIGSTAISGITGDTVQAQMEALKAFIDAAILGYINDGTITDDKLSNAPGQIKEQINTFAPHLSKLVTDTDGIHGLKMETGIWTPTISLETAGTIVYTIQQGNFVRIGKIVTCNFFIRCSSVTGGAGIIEIVGLPFTPSNLREVGIVRGRLGTTGLSFATVYNGGTANRFRITKSTNDDADASQINSGSKLDLFGSITYGIA